MAKKDGLSLLIVSVIGVIAVFSVLQSSLTGRAIDSVSCEKELASLQSQLDFYFKERNVIGGRIEGLKQQNLAYNRELSSLLKIKQPSKKELGMIAQLKQKISDNNKMIKQLGEQANAVSRKIVAVEQKVAGLKKECNVVPVEPKCDVTSEINRGEKQTFSVGGVEYEVLFADILKSNPSVFRFILNGEQIDLRQYEGKTLHNGMQFWLGDVGNYDDGRVDAGICFVAGEQKPIVIKSFGLGTQEVVVGEQVYFKLVVANNVRQPLGSFVTKVARCTKTNPLDDCGPVLDKQEHKGLKPEEDRLIYGNFTLDAAGKDFIAISVHSAEKLIATASAPITVLQQSGEERIRFRSASWTCQDGVSVEAKSPKGLTSTSVEEKFMEKELAQGRLDLNNWVYVSTQFCRGRCISTSDGNKCGIAKFSVYDEVKDDNKNVERVACEIDYKTKFDKDVKCTVVYRNTNKETAECIIKADDDPYNICYPEPAIYIEKPTPDIGFSPVPGLFGMFENIGCGSIGSVYNTDFFFVNCKNPIIPSEPKCDVKADMKLRESNSFVVNGVEYNVVFDGVRILLRPEEAYFIVNGEKLALHQYEGKTLPNSGNSLYLNDLSEIRGKGTVASICFVSGGESQSTCTDSDGGRNIFVGGTTKGKKWGGEGEGVHIDYCIKEGVKKGRLAEGYCKDGMIFTESFGPEDGCSICTYEKGSDAAVCVN
ncbi:hypothetical protein HY486_02940 [Candidatus Woesearchaeota archaeon]|nr:hypothetical protein [Candidatus Woesearchaeota archaeon]